MTVTASLFSSEISIDVFTACVSALGDSCLLAVVVSVFIFGSVHSQMNSSSRGARSLDVKLWGKLRGTENDYYVADAVLDASLKKRKFYSVDGVDWVLVPEVGDDVRQLCALITVPFTGNPTFQYQIPASTERESPREASTTPEKKPKMKTETTTANKHESPRADTQAVNTSIEISEEKRLAVTVMDIDADTSVVPCGAYLCTPDHRIVPNSSFCGLTLKEAQNLNSYCHLRYPSSLQGDAVEREAIFPSSNFLDSLAEDIKGTWSLHFNSLDQRVTLRSLLWPGFAMCSTPSTPQYSSLYIGDGTRNTISFLAS
ncbi:radial spoke head protein 9 [Pelomyxa schiedti]|nr:radial spoke head protein 9 [Pelomyxa schiedti]